MSTAPNAPTTQVPAPDAAQPPAPAPQPTPAAPTRPPKDPVSRLLLAASAAVLLGWFGWLSYAALTKSREPTVSHAQAAVATVPVVATVTADDKGAPLMKVTVVEPLKSNGPPAKTVALVTNMSTAKGFAGEGDYLLLLAPDPPGFLPDGTPVLQLVGARGTFSESEPATIYRWTPDVAAQAKRMYPAKD